MSTVAFEARRFQSTAAYYLRYRIPYPDRLIARVANRCSLEIGDPLLATRLGQTFAFHEFEAALAYESSQGAKAVLIP